MLDLKIENADITYLYELNNIDSSYEYEQYSIDTLKGFLENPNIDVYVAKLKNICVGYIVVNTIFDESDLIKIVILPSYRSFSIGKELLNCMIKNLKIKGVKKIFLEVRKNNFIAKSFYEGMGFLKISERECYYKDGVNCEIYELCL